MSDFGTTDTPTDTITDTRPLALPGGAAPPPNDPPGPPHDPSDESGNQPPHGGSSGPSWATTRLVRPREGRIVGGVCAALAETFGIDVLLIRVAAVVLLAFGGLGVLLYGALWLLTPSADAPAPLEAGRPSGARRVLTVAVVVAALAVVGTRFAWYGFGGAFLSLAVIVGLIALVMQHRRLRTALAVAVIVLVALCGLVMGFGSHLGSRSYAVSSTNDLWRTYSAPTGTLRVDLSTLNNGGGRHVRAVVGSGNVVVTVPSSDSGITVHIRGRSGVGSVHVLGRSASGFGSDISTVTNPVSFAGSSSDLWVDAIAGTGTVTVRTGS
jgi:phage shock protein PspC (stress-responsive transcriptional regulator)